MKKIIALLLAAMMFLTLAPVSLAAEDEAAAAAQKLHALGLFNGIGTDADGNPTFALDRTPTRHEAVTMLVRLLGKEEAALAGKWEIPFTDVAEWAKPYVGYAYAKGLTNGISPTAFGGENIVSAAQYLTFVLRALGYKSGVDFVWERAWELTDRLGITDGEYNAENDTFVRGDLAIISADALEQPMKDEKITLVEHIQAEKAKPKDDKPKDPPTTTVAPDPGSDSNGQMNEGSYTTGSGTLVTEDNVLRITPQIAGEITRVIVSNPSVCTAQIDKDSIVLTRTGDGLVNLQIYYMPRQESEETTSPETTQTTPGTPPDTSKPHPSGMTKPPVREQRTDVKIRFGPLPKVPGLSLEYNDQIIQNGFGFGTYGKTSFSAKVLLDGNPVHDCTVSCSDPSTKITVSAGGTLLIEKSSSGRVTFTVTCGEHQATFSVTS